MSFRAILSMRRHKIEFELSIYDSLEELPTEERHLMNMAVDARGKAYAPYSQFNVGAALLLDTGEIIKGNNQENASYPSGLCAERVAIFSAGANHPNAIVKAIAITAASEKIKVASPVAPCGNCRQSIKEYEVKQGSPIKLLLMGERGEVYKCESVADILPLGFDSSYLG